MRAFVVSLLTLLTLALAHTPFATAAEKIRVVTTIPDLADMTRRITGDLVDVPSLANGVEDVHAVPIKPSFGLLLIRADIIVLLRLDAAQAFFPGRLEAASTPGHLGARP